MIFGIIQPKYQTFFIRGKNEKSQVLAWLSLSEMVVLLYLWKI